MIIGNPEKFAIESKLSIVDGRASILGIGYFAIHIAGTRYGVVRDDATCLGCSVSEVQQRERDRGLHTAPFSTSHAKSIASAVEIALYGDSDLENFYELDQYRFTRLIYDHRLLWAPDGDAAFDDGSRVLHFDIHPDVRLIGFRADEEHHPLPDTISDIIISADEYYSLLHEWQQRFISRRQELLRKEQHPT